MDYDEEQAKFTALVRGHFGFLVREYDCYVTKIFPDYAPVGKILFQSQTTVVKVEYERNIVGTWLGPSAEPELAWLPLNRIVDFLVTGNRLLTQQILNTEFWQSANWESQLRRQSLVLRASCQYYLRGDFSQWLGVLKFTLTKLQKEHRALYGKDFPETSLAHYIALRESRLLKNSNKDNKL